MEILEKTFGTRKVTLYKAEGTSLPVVYLNMYIPDGRKMLEDCAAAGAPAFHLVTFGGIQWDQDLSPWPHDPVVDKDDDFTGQAPEYLRFITDTAMPWVKEQVPDMSVSAIAGYSMGGLFALWALTQTAAFDAAACVSGSVWYPDFTEYFCSHPFAGHPRAIYLSLGNKESRVRNPYLQKTQQNMETILEACRQRGIDCIFRLVEGNHFQNADTRTANGIAWVLQQSQSGEEKRPE